MADQIGNVTGQVRIENSPAQVRMQDRPGGVDDPAQMARFFCLQAGDDGPVKVIAGKRLVPLAGQDGLTPFIQYVPDGIADSLARFPLLPGQQYRPLQ